MLLKAQLQDAGAVTRLALALWPDNDEKALLMDFQGLLEHPGAAIFLFFDEGRPVGFAQVQLRHDYVEGTASYPVGYLEGIYVEAALRCRGIARALLAACQAWAKEKGASEFASDCELHNTQSLAWHLKMGFVEANRIICFTKAL